jgi:hypothetical protein
MLLPSPEEGGSSVSPPPTDTEADMARRSAVLISLAAIGVLTLFSSTAVAKGPGLVTDPSKVVIDSDTATSAFASVVVTNNTGAALPPRTWSLTGAAGGGIITPVTVVTDPLSPDQGRNCVASGGPTSGRTVSLGDQALSQCTFLIKYEAPALAGKYMAKLKASFGADRIAVAITVNVAP